MYYLCTANRPPGPGTAAIAAGVITAKHETEVDLFPIFGDTDIAQPHTLPYGTDALGRQAGTCPVAVGSLLGVPQPVAPLVPHYVVDVPGAVSGSLQYSTQLPVRPGRNSRGYVAQHSNQQSRRDGGNAVADISGCSAGGCNIYTHSRLCRSGHPPTHRIASSVPQGAEAHGGGRSVALPALHRCGHTQWGMGHT